MKNAYVKSHRMLYAKTSLTKILYFHCAEYFLKVCLFTINHSSPFLCSEISDLDTDIINVLFCWLWCILWNHKATIHFHSRILSEIPGVQNLLSEENHSTDLECKNFEAVSFWQEKCTVNLRRNRSYVFSSGFSPWLEIGHLSLKLAPDGTSPPHLL